MQQLERVGLALAALFENNCWKFIRALSVIKYVFPKKILLHIFGGESIYNSLFF